MTTFAEYLVAASSLSSGTVWDLITHPRTDGTGTIYDQVHTVLDDALISSSLKDDTVQASVGDSTISSSVNVIDATTLLLDSTIIGQTS